MLCTKVFLKKVAKFAQCTMSLLGVPEMTLKLGLHNDVLNGWRCLTGIRKSPQCLF